MRPSRHAIYYAIYSHAHPPCCCKTAHKLSFARKCIRSDSTLIVKAIKGLYATCTKDIVAIQAKCLERRIQWIRRAKFCRPSSGEKITLNHESVLARGSEVLDNIYCQDGCFVYVPSDSVALRDTGIVPVNWFSFK